MGGPKGINWEQALEFYLTPDFEGKIPSYQDVANKFGVSKKEVGLRAKRENWLQRRQNVYDTAEETGCIRQLWHQWHPEGSTMKDHKNI